MNKNIFTKLYLLILLNVCQGYQLLKKIHPDSTFSYKLCALVFKVQILGQAPMEVTISPGTEIHLCNKKIISAYII